MKKSNTISRSYPFLLTSFLLISYGITAQNNASYKKNSVPIGGFNSSAFGVGALIVNTGRDNTATGNKALTRNTSGSNNAAYGVQALSKNITGNHNTAYGNYALASNIASSYNVATGSFALNANTGGEYNTASGYQSLYFNTSGRQNTANGTQTLYLNTTGSLNTANGVYALIFNTEGSNNTATGSNAMHFNSIGNENTADGTMALFSNSEGGRNTATGLAALFGNTTGVGNTAAGYYALVFNNAGSYNTGVGYNAGPTERDLVNTTSIGNGAVALASDQVRIGNSAVTSIGGFQSWTNVSDQRVKKDVQEKVPGLAFINKLRPVTYHMDLNAIAGFLKTDVTTEGAAQAMLHTGLIAQEVEKAALDMGYDFSGVDKPKSKEDLYGLRYAEFTIPLIKAVQELSKQNEEMKKELTALKEVIKNSSPTGVVNPVGQGKSQLYQNSPNPFTQSTTINYSIEPTAKKAVLTIMSITGEKIKEVDLTGKSQVEINAGELAAGTYIYSLIVDDTLIDCKKITLTQ